MSIYHVLTMRLPVVVTRLLLLALFAGTLVFAAWVFYNPNPCLVPLEYSIGRVDKQFDISRAEFRALALEAETVWEDEIGHELFQYDPDAVYTVNLIFDDRQQTVNQSRQIRGELDELSDEHRVAVEKYRTLKRQLTQREQEYKTLKNRFDEKQQEYNARVQQINKKGGATPQQQSKLASERDALGALQEQVNTEADAINELQRQINQLAQKEDAILDEYQATADTYADRYGDAHRFEQGQATGEAINIYQYNTSKDLRLVLAHEFGHTLGIEHVESAKAVMHFLMGEQQLDPIILTESDKAALVETCEEASYFQFL